MCVTADGCVDSALRSQIVECFEPEAAQSDPELLAAAVKLGCSALLYHPSLVDVLCFPTKLAVAAPDGKVGLHSNSTCGTAAYGSAEDLNASVAGQQQWHYAVCITYPEGKQRSIVQRVIGVPATSKPP